LALFQWTGVTSRMNPGEARLFRGCRADHPLRRIPPSIRLR